VFCSWARPFFCSEEETGLGPLSQRPRVRPVWWFYLFRPLEKSCRQHLQV
jgi:hypothetical protein